MQAKMLMKIVEPCNTVESKLLVKLSHESQLFRSAKDSVNRATEVYIDANVQFLNFERKFYVVSFSLMIMIACS